jgi:hypothetical protein
MTRDGRTDEAAGPGMNDRWYVPLAIAGGVVIVLLMAGVAALEVFAARAASEAPSAWYASLTKMDEAIARGDIPGAAAQWREAHRHARGGRQWEPLIDVGDGYRRLGRAAGAERAAEAQARDAYLGGLLRARQLESLEGVLRAAEAFAELGDREVVEQCMRVARGLAARAADPVTVEQVKRFADRWAARTLEVERGRATRSGSINP